MKNIRCVIIGAGVTGLLLSKKMLDLGCQVTLLEKSEYIAGFGASIRNEGWLHRGTYHAISIENKSSAISVAQRCIWGYDFIKNYAPESIEEPDLYTFAVTKNYDKEYVLDRWKSAEVEYEEIDLNILKSMVENINIENIKHAFKVKDRSINTRVLYQKLYTEIVVKGGEVIFKSDFIMKDNNTIIINGNINIQYDICVFSSGFANGNLINEKLGVKISSRFWKSHLCLTKRISNYSIFSIDKNEAAMINHGKYSIIGLNNDAELEDNYNTKVKDNNKEKLIIAIQKLFKIVSIEDTISCCKMDFVDMKENRSLEISVKEIMDNHFCIFPGKMTETPFLVDYFIRIINDRFCKTVAKRPVDCL